MAAYTLDWQHDLFVSYGRVDDQAGDDEQGWVSQFVEDLKKRLSERLGRKDTFSMWQDEQDLARNSDFAKDIANAIETSACMLVILSPGYLISDWCKRERNDFLKWMRDRNESGGRIFMIERDWIEVEEEKPEEFRKLLGYKFWTGEPSNLANAPRPLDKHRQSDRGEYDDQINRVALAITSALRQLKSEAMRKAALNGAVPDAPQEVPQPPRVAPAPSTVYLAEVTDDLRSQWKKVRTELDQQGLRVVSAGTPRDVESLEKAVAEALQESKLFVQLLSQFPGQALASSSESYALLQYRLAAKSGTPIFQWRSPQLTEEVFDQQEFEDAALAAKYRELVFGRVRAEHIEDFKRYVIEVAKAPPEQVASPPTGADLGMIFVNFIPNGDDEKFASQLCGYLELKGFDVIRPVEVADAKPEEIRADFESNVLRSRSSIVVYGDNKSKFWVRGQLNEINQLLCEHNHAGTIQLCAGPPAPKEVDRPLQLVGVKLRRMSVIDCQTGFDGERFGQFLDAMNTSHNGKSDNSVEIQVAVRAT
jgi:TIR domain